MVDIRPATVADRDAIVALLLAQFREHTIATPADRVAAAVEGVLGHPRRGAILLAHVDGRPVGLAALSFTWTLEHGGRTAWLEELYVDPALRARGIGTELLHAAVGVATAAGAAAVDLEVDADHARAARLYQREGFAPLPRARWARKLVPEPRSAPAPPTELTGGCFCGAIRYRVDEPPVEVSHCHCSICRRTTGAPFVTWATFHADRFAFTTGRPTELRATPRAVRTLCATCGTALTFRETARDRCVDVTVGSLDRAEAVVAQGHIWVTSRLSWLRVDDDLPEHPGENPRESDCS